MVWNGKTKRTSWKGLLQRQKAHKCAPPSQPPLPSSKGTAQGIPIWESMFYFPWLNARVHNHSAFCFFLVDFAFVFKANSVDFKIKLLSWKECTAQCSLHPCRWRFIYCRRRLVSHWNHFAWMWLLSHALEGTGHYSISCDNSRQEIYPAFRFTSVTKCPLVLLCNFTVTSGDK